MATAPSSHPDTTTLDEILPDLAALLELSPYDRRIAESRSRRLKEHVECPSSSLRPYLVDGESLIYAQDSVATSTTVRSGDQDDRFDIDAIFEIDVPAGWSDDRALDELFATLQGFPGAQKIKRPPSVWITKLTGDIGHDPRGLSHQLFSLAGGISANLRAHLANGTVPNEPNPSYWPDRLNDRWPRPLPAGRTDMECLADHLDALKTALNRMLFATQHDILKEIDRLFGETFGAAEREILKKRYDRRERNSDILIKSGSGAVFAPALVRAQPDLRPVPQHRFHPTRWPVRGSDGE